MLLCVQVLHLKIHLENKRVYTSSSMSNSLRIYMDKEKHQNFISWPFCKMSVGLCNLQNAIYKNTIMRTYKIGLQALKLPCILDKLSICGSSKYHMISKLCQGYFNAISKIGNLMSETRWRRLLASVTCQEKTSCLTFDFTTRHCLYLYDCWMVTFSTWRSVSWLSTLPSHAIMRCIIYYTILSSIFLAIGYQKKSIIIRNIYFQFK